MFREVSCYFAMPGSHRSFFLISGSPDFVSGCGAKSIRVPKKHLDRQHDDKLVSLEAITLLSDKHVSCSLLMIPNAILVVLPVSALS